MWRESRFASSDQNVGFANCADVCGFANTTVAQILGKQLLHSGTSVGANYREAYRARSDAEFVAKMGLCRQELEESAYWLELLAESDTISAVKLAALQDEVDQLTAIFTTIIKKRLQNNS